MAPLHFMPVDPRLVEHGTVVNLPTRFTNGDQATIFDPSLCVDAAARPDFFPESFRTTAPVSSRDFRLETIFGQPPDTAAINWDGPYAGVVALLLVNRTLVIVV